MLRQLTTRLITCRNVTAYKLKYCAVVTRKISLSSQLCKDKDVDLPFELFEDFRIKSTTEEIMSKKSEKAPLNEPETMRYIKLREKWGGKFPVPSFIDVHVVATGRMGTPRSILITTEHLR